ncbi:hypothetical protein GP486_001745 [Trichoglossum hirsutum]|uniref:Protein SQS1 n=1 Tax=Trichoglossum hirsutum TaxID=265104 RepID=A0A9P8LFJ7_9PEZI|nr:hypothetical protein GP486_001745 [Trichoglossum hirsutum]
MVRSGGGARRGKKGGKRDREGGRDSEKIGWKSASRSLLPLFSAGYGGTDAELQPYSLQDEARNTGRSRSPFWSSSRLRDNKITFVSAGHFDAKKLMELESSGAQSTKNTRSPAESLQEIAPQPNDSSEQTYTFENSQPVEESGLVSGYSQDTGATPPGGSETVTEVYQDAHETQSSSSDSVNSAHEGLSLSPVRAPSPTPSSSSQEVILFSGRNQDTGIANEQAARRPTSSGSAFAESYDQDVPDSVLQTSGDSAIIILTKSSSSEIAGSSERITPPSRRKRGIRDREEDAAIADYIANMKEHGDPEGFLPGETYKLRELGDTDVGSWQEFEPENEPLITEDQTAAKKYAVHGWATLDPHHPVVDSTPVNTLGDIDSILTKRSRPDGDQFLVQFKGYSINDVRWIPRASLVTETQLKHIAAFEGADGPEPGIYESEESGDTDEDREERRDLQQYKVADRADEKLARLFARRDGLGTAFEGLTVSGNTDETSDEALVDDEGFATVLGSTGNRVSQRRVDLSSATQIANAYDDFDVMDFERPSLKRGKGRKAALPLNLSDSDLEAKLRSVWGKDRKKKAERKREREELRTRGFLDKYNATNRNVRAKYSQDMTAEEVESEIYGFLVSDREQLSFPLMEVHQRKMLHEVGAVLNLKSKSVGPKLQRFTTLYKTSSTVSDPSDIERAFNRIRSRGFLPRMGHRNQKGKARPRNDWAGATYRDGEIVGAAAPELGAENKGRQMLEKMGWSSGTALGALNNKGILQPVATVVKRSKAGLG